MRSVPPRSLTPWNVISPEERAILDRLRTRLELDPSATVAIEEEYRSGSDA